MLIHMDGFDLYTPNNNASDLGFQYAGWNGGIGTNSGRFGQGSFLSNSEYSFLQYVFPSPQIEIWTGFAVKIAYPTNNQQPIFSIFSASGREAEFWYGNSTWYSYRGQSQVLLGSATVSLTPNSFHWVEFHYLISSTVGVMEIWIDDTQISNLTAINTTAFNNTSFTSVTLGGNITNNNVTGIYDDWYILNTVGTTNNKRLGDCRIETLVPNSDAGINNGTPLSGTSHYAMVDGSQNNQGTSNITITNTPGQEELFGENNLANTPSTIFGVKVLNVAKKTDAGSCYGNAVISSGSAVAYSNAKPLITAYSATLGIFETDPNTNATWTYTAVNASDAGFRVSPNVSGELPPGDSSLPPP
jgi:hypothetical protein